MRALFGAEREAEGVDTRLHAPAAVAELSDRLGGTSSPHPQAAAKLVRRGLARRSTEGRRKVLVLAPGVAEWLRSFPVREANRPGRAA
jgi:hypothetical protein